MAPNPPRVVLAPQPQQALVHDGPPRGGAERKKDAARVAHGQLFIVSICHAQAGPGYGMEPDHEEKRVPQRQGGQEGETHTTRPYIYN